MGGQPGGNAVGLGITLHPGKIAFPGNHVLALACDAQCSFGVFDSLEMFSSAFGANQYNRAVIEIDVSLHVAPP